MQARSQEAFGWMTHMAIKTGRLMTLARIETLPGDSLDVGISTSLEMHPLRRNSGLGIKMQLFAFWQPLRWTYTNFMTAAVGEYGNNQNYSATRQIPNNYHGEIPALQSKRNTVLHHIIADYGRIVDHYFREPHTPRITDTNVITSNLDSEYGYLCWQLPSWETSPNYDDSHDQTQIPANPNALDLALYTATARDQQAKDWQAIRIQDIYNYTYGGELNNEQEKVPYMLMPPQENYLESYATKPEGMGGTQSTSIAQIAGSLKGQIRRRFFAEHGTIWIMGLTRVRPSYKYTENYLDNPTHFGASKKLLGHPAGNAEAPINITLADLYSNSTSSASAGYQPWYQWYREKPDYWSPTFFEEDEGWPPRNTPTTKDGIKRHPDYGDIFYGSQFGEGLQHTSIGLQGARNFGGGMESIKGPDLSMTERN